VSLKIYTYKGQEAELSCKAEPRKMSQANTYIGWLDIRSFVEFLILIIEKFRVERIKVTKKIFLILYFASLLWTVFIRIL